MIVLDSSSGKIITTLPIAKAWMPVLTILSANVLSPPAVTAP